MDGQAPIRSRVTHARRGHTLLELVMAGFVMAIVLAPAMTLMSRNMELSRTIDTLNMINTLCVSKLEEHLALAAASFSNNTATGDFATDGYPGLRFLVVRSDDPVDGGIADQLMVVTATVWDDINGNGTVGADEPVTTFSSKIARLATYEDEATSS